MSAETDRPRLLGEFLRSRRERISPADTGIQAGGRRRRTPGLRREEVAQLADLSPTWYTWIEQGRRISVSPDALARIAEALQLTTAERTYLFELAEKHDPDGDNPQAGNAPPPGLLATVKSIQEPAYLLDAAWEACAWNQPAIALFADWLGGTELNLLRYVFLDPRAKGFIRNWEERTHRLVEEFRADTSHYGEDERVSSLVQELKTRSPSFAKLWSGYGVRPRSGGARLFNRVEGDQSRYEQVTLRPATAPAYKLVVLIPVNQET